MTVNVVPLGQDRSTRLLNEARELFLRSIFRDQPTSAMWSRCYARLRIAVGRSYPDALRRHDETPVL